MDDPNRSRPLAPVRKTRTLAEWTDALVPTLVVAGDYASRRQPSPGRPTPSWEAEPASLDVVRFTDCDPFGHLNNGRYLDYFINARDFQMATFFNLDLARHSARHNETWLVMEHQIAYLKPVRLKEEIIVVSRHLDFTDRETFVEAWMLDATGTTLKALLWSRFGYVDTKTGKKALHPRYILDILGSTKVTVEEYRTRDFAARVRSAPDEVRLRALRGEASWADKAVRAGLRAMPAPGSGRTEPWTGAKAVAATATDAARPEVAGTSLSDERASPEGGPAAARSPWLYKQAFQVRSSDVDPNLAAKPAACLEWFQDAIIEGGARAGYSLTSSFERGRAWAFRRYRLAWTKAIRHEDPLEARAWVSRIAGGEGVWELEVVRRDGGERVFAGRCELEYLDLATMSRTEVEPEVVSLMRPNGLSVGMEPALAAPEIEVQNGPSFAVRRTVQADDLDLSQQVPAPVYLRWSADAVHGRLWDVLGGDATRARVVEADIVTGQPVFYGMEVVVTGRMVGHDDERMYWTVETTCEGRTLATISLVLRSKRTWNTRAAAAGK